MPLIAFWGKEVWSRPRSVAQSLRLAGQCPDGQPGRPPLQSVAPRPAGGRGGHLKCGFAAGAAPQSNSYTGGIARAPPAGVGRSRCKWGSVATARSPPVRRPDFRPTLSTTFATASRLSLVTGGSLAACLLSASCLLRARVARLPKKLNKENEERNGVGIPPLDTYRNNFHLAQKKNCKLRETTAVKTLKKPPNYAIINNRVS